MIGPWETQAELYGGFVDADAHPFWLTTILLRAQNASAGLLTIAFVDMWGKQVPGGQFTFTIDNSKDWGIGDMLATVGVNKFDGQNGYLMLPGSATGTAAVGAVCYLDAGSGYLLAGFGGDKTGLSAHEVAATTPFIPIKPGTMFKIGRVHNFSFQLMP